MHKIKFIGSVDRKGSHAHLDGKVNFCGTKNHHFQLLQAAHLEGYADIPGHLTLAPVKKLELSQDFGAESFDSYVVQDESPDVQHLFQHCSLQRLFAGY